MLPDGFWEDLEDEPCDGCGARPSKHEGHGAFTCRGCYEARWCPKCTYPLGPKPAEHACTFPTPAEREKQRVWFDLFMAERDQGADFFEKTVVPMAHRIAELEDHIRWIWANEDYSNSYGRNQKASRVLTDIAERRGDDWPGADVVYEKPAKPGP